MLNKKNFLSLCSPKWADQSLTESNKPFILAEYHKMSTKNLMAIAEEAFAVEPRENGTPDFKAGDTITVTIRIREGNKERMQNFRGVVIQRRGAGTTETFTIRKMSDNVGVERIFPVNSPTIVKIEVNKRGVVRRARIFYLRALTGKKARIKERARY